MASLDASDNAQLLYRQAPPLVYKSIPQEMQMSFPVSLLQWKIERCGGNLSQRSSNCITHIIVNWSCVKKKHNNVGGAFGRGADRKFQSSIRWVSFSLLWKGALAATEGRRLYDTRDGFISTFLLKTPLYGDSQSFTVGLQSWNLLQKGGLNFLLMFESGCLFYLSYYCDVYLSLVFNLSVMSVV